MVRVSRFLVAALLVVGPGCERADKRAEPAPPKDAGPPPRPTSFPSCSADYAPRPDRDPSPMCYVLGGRYEVTAVGYNDPPPVLVDVEDFLIDQHEITVAQFVRFLNDSMPLPDCEWPENLCHRYPVQPAPPVVFENGRFAPQPGQADGVMDTAPIRLLDAYCHWAGKRLPTHWQWDVAAHYDTEGVRRKYPWGDEPDVSRMNCREPDCADGILGLAPPGSLRDVSAWGVLDLAGNVNEVVRGCYGEGCEGPCRHDPSCWVTTAGSHHRGGPIAQEQFWPVGDADQGGRCATTVPR